MTSDPFDERCPRCHAALEHDGQQHECEAFGDVVREHLVAVARGTGRMLLRTLKRLGLVE
jgi:hypothetical protein